MAIVNEDGLGQVKIYMLSHPITSEPKYIGKTIHELDERLKQHIKLAKYKQTTHRTKWISSLLKQGLYPKIELLEFVDSSNWQFWEQYWICQFKVWGFKLTNGTLGGDGVNLTNEIKEKQLVNLRIAMKTQMGDNNVSKRPEVREKISIALKGRTICEEWKTKMRGKRKGMSDEFKKKRSEYMKNNVSILFTQSNKGIKHTDERKAKVAETRKKHGLYICSEKLRKSISDRRKGVMSWSKKVKQINIYTGEEKIWESANEVNRFFYNKSGDTIASYVRSSKLFRKQFKFEYI
jgi:galactitol-specific phosphotransferase system IIB component